MKEKLLEFWANKRKRWIGLSLLASLFLGLILVWILFPAEKAEIGTVVRGNAVAAVYGTVTAEPETQVLIKSRTAGVIKKILVSQGDVVKENDPMAQIEDKSLGTSLKEMKVDMESAEQRLKIGSSSANELKSRMQELDRIKPLVRDGIIAPMELQRLEGVIQDLKNKVSQEKVELEQAVQVSRTKYENARNEIEQGVIKSPINGEVLEVFARLGEVVLNQSQLFVVGSKKTHLLAVVNEEDVGAIKEGMKASVRLYSFGKKDFDAVVYKIRPQAQNQSFEVILHLVDQLQDVRSGMTGEANIVIGQRENTLMVPTRALRDGNQLYVVRNGRVRIQRVKTGYRNIEFCEILDGVVEGDKIILSEQDRFGEGMRVSPL